MKPNPNLDELLGSFIDGELSPRQRTEVQRMAAHDPAVARRLQQLQNCRTLFCSLPMAEAPGDLLEQVKQSLERKVLLQEQPIAPRRSAGVIHLVFRRLVAAAAMIALVAVLGAVVYQIVAPVSGPASMVATLPGSSEPIATNVIPPALVVADAGFSGELELQTAAFVSTDAFIRQAIGASGLANPAPTEAPGDRRVYQVTGTRESLNRLVASLGGAWPKFDEATLYVAEPDSAETPVAVEAVTADQMAAIVACNSTEASVQMARTYGAINYLARNMPGREILPLIYEDPGVLGTAEIVPTPRLAGPNDPIQKTHTPPQGMAQASLKIVLLRTK